MQHFDSSHYYSFAVCRRFPEGKIVDNRFMTSELFQVIIFLLLFSMADVGRHVPARCVSLSPSNVAVAAKRTHILSRITQCISPTQLNELNQKT